jgi:hypothetical protein
VRFEDSGLSPIRTAFDIAVDAQLEAAAVFGVDQHTKHRISIKARNAQPVNRARPRYQRRTPGIADDGVLADWRLGQRG